MNMQFLNVSNNVSNHLLNKKPVPQNNTLPNMGIMRHRSLNIRQEQPVIIPEEPKKKMIWGPPIWFLFHTLAEKVKDESFQQIRNDILNNIYAIAINLPCPICSTHAKEYLDRINFKTIQSKNDLKNMMFQFHNEVNKRKGYSMFPMAELDEKYSKAVTVNIIQNFMFHFQDKQRSPKLIANDMQRMHIARRLKEWFNANIVHFNQ
jgi:hypothetical protein